MLHLFLSFFFLPLLPLSLHFFLFLTNFPLILHASTEIPLARNYRAFGPLPYTSPYRGINPLRSISINTHRSLLSTILSLRTFPSESAIGGHATWRDCPYNRSAKGVITAPFPDADPSLPYDAVAVANFTVKTPQTHPHLVQCSDSATVIPLQVDPQFRHLVHSLPNNASTECPSDSYEDGRRLCALRLYPGTYQIFVFLSSASNSTEFYCNYYIDPALQNNSLLHPIADVVTPTIIAKRQMNTSRATLAGPHCSVTLTNIHPTLWASKGAASLRDAPKGLKLAAQSQSDSHYPLPRIAPRQVRQLRVDLLAEQDFLADKELLPSVVNATLVVAYDLGDGAQHQVEFDLSFDVAVWRESRSYHFTYVDVDGTIQAAAVLPPKYSCVGSPIGNDMCNVLLSTHGAGVDAVADAWTESYRTQNQSWVLLPTGRRKFGLNWEGPQMMSAVTALRALAANLPGVPLEEKELWRPRSDFWLQAGHSMGGHGALLLSTHFPDMLVAALPAMGWLRLSSYGNREFGDQLSYSDAAMRALMTVASAEYSADLYAVNLLGIPFLARVGSDDDNVPPSKLRKFYRLLKENEFLGNIAPSLANLSEVSGKGHWFDGVVDDDVLQGFIEKHLNAFAKPSLPKTFTVLTMNPATTGSRGGLRILSLEVPFQIGRIHVVRNQPEAGTWRVATENIRRFRYRPVFGILERPERLFIDSSSGSVSIDAKTLEREEKHIDFCVTQMTTSHETETRAVVWQRCRDESTWGTERSKERGPDTSGPSSQILAKRKLIIVFPEDDLELQDMAVSYANSLYIRGISAQVTTDSNVSIGQLNSAGESNMVLLGGPNMNQMSLEHYSSGYTADVSFNGNRFCVVSKCFSKPGIGIAFLSPGPKRTLLFYVAGTDRDGVLSALSFLPYSPASNVPEWVIVSKQRGWGVQGLGGVIGLGYWDYKWKLEVRKSYPAEFAFDLKRSGVTCSVGQDQAAYYRWSGAFLGVSAVLLCLLLCVCRKRIARKPAYGKVSAEEIDVRSRAGRGETFPVEKEALLNEITNP